MEFQIRLLHLDQRGVGLYVVAGFHQNLLHRSGVIGYDGVFHLHRFEHGDLLTGLDAVADFDLDLRIRPGSGALTVLPVIGCPAGPPRPSSPLSALRRPSSPRMPSPSLPSDRFSPPSGTIRAAAPPFSFSASFTPPASGQFGIGLHLVFRGVVKASPHARRRFSAGIRGRSQQGSCRIRP